MKLVELVRVSREVAESSARGKKIATLALALGRMTPEEVEIAVPILSGEVRQGRTGVGWAAVQKALAGAAAAEASLSLSDLDEAFSRLAALSGKGSSDARNAGLASLFGRATGEERDFLARLVHGELRQGAQEGVVAEAVAKASGVAAASVRRAAMLSGDLATVARAALAEGAAGVDRFRLVLLRPIRPMLAQTAEDVAHALGELDDAALEHKLDGARIQVHRSDDEVRVFTRTGNDVTASVPEIVESTLALPARSLVLDGEAIGLGPDGRPLPFQETMARFGSRTDVAGLRMELPLSPFYFDALHVDGDDLLERPARDRAAALAALVPDAMRVLRVVPASVTEAEAFFEATIALGHEGVVAKSQHAAYEAGNRGAAWLKIKRANTLDLVVLAVEWGSGRRKGLLSNLHLGARDPATGGFVMLGKTFKGLTDAMLAWQTKALLALETSREGHVVHVRPELVVEIAFDGVQSSSRYPGGLALRFARVKAHRPDKSASAADTIETVRALWP